MIKTKSSKIAQLIIVAIMVLFSIIIIYPFIYCLSYSLSDSKEVMLKSVTLFPVKLTLQNYYKVFQNNTIYSAALISVIRTVAGVVWALFCTTLAAYAISKKDLPGNKLFSIFFIIPMYITGGMIPSYIVIHDLHLFNNILVYILPHGFYAFNMLLVRTYIDTIPPSMEESAKIDGAGYLKVFLMIIIPLSLPIIAVLAMFVGVWQWNAWFDVVLYITKQDLYPLQRILQMLLEEAYASSSKLISGEMNSSQNSISPESLRMATLIITTVPIIMIYPFFQKHFVGGIMVGAVKG